ncbi:hypothetical protein KY284_013009 [Solanum tuberosum]|nr:hypothetical protein KY284_013009 [Solanum tuberosum]
MEDEVTIRCYSTSVDTLTILFETHLSPSGLKSNHPNKFQMVSDSYSQRVGMESLWKRSGILNLDGIRLNHMNIFIQLPFDPGDSVESEEYTRNKVIASNITQPEFVGSYYIVLAATRFTTTNEEHSSRLLFLKLCSTTS